ncbi:MAG: NADPH-dependent F420 reductase [Candidatus Acidiferrales bacterium]
MNRKIAIIGGTGAEGTGLALRWVRAHESIIIGSRDAQKARQVAEDIRSKTGFSTITGAENGEAVTMADVVVLTIPFASHAPVVKSLRQFLRAGSILIDTTVPLAAAVGGVPTRTLGVWQGSAAQQAAELAPEGVLVAAAFHNVSAGALKRDEPVDSDVVVCSDHSSALQTASELAEKIPGVRAINGGPLENSRLLEQLTALILSINGRYKVHRTGVRFTGLPVPPPRLD